MTKIILHIGMHKTGSTSIQHALNRYNDGSTKYAELGVVNHSIPFYTAFSKNYLNYHVWAAQGLDEQQIKQKKIEYTNKLKNILNENKDTNLIFSGEDISSLSEDEVLNLYNLLKIYSDDIHVYGYFRQPISFIESRLQEDIQAGFRLNIGPINYRKKFSRFTNVFGQSNVNLRVFDKEKLLEKNIVNDFINWIKIDNRNLNKKLINKHVNTSLSTDAIKLLYLLNSNNSLTSGDKVLLRARSLLINILFELYPGKFKLPNYLIYDSLDIDDINWMEKIGQTKFQLDEINTTGKYESLTSFMEDVSNDSIDILTRYLASMGISNEFNREPIKLINRLYYLCLSNTFRYKNKYRRFKNKLSQFKY